MTSMFFSMINSEMGSEQRDAVEVKLSDQEIKELDDALSGRSLCGIH